MKSNLLEQLSAILQKQKPTLDFHPGLTKSAVMILLDNRNDESHIVLTKRTEHLPHHKGQICFPGGVCDEGDSDLWNTALREVKEEIGVDEGPIQFIGELSPIMTPTGFWIKPFVAALTSPQEFQPNQDEIAELFLLPLSHLFDTKNLTFVKRSYPENFVHQALPQEVRHSMINGNDDPTFIYNNHQIWGATARILVELVEAMKSI